MWSGRWFRRSDCCCFTQTQNDRFGLLRVNPLSNINHLWDGGGDSNIVKPISGLKKWAGRKEWQPAALAANWKTTKSNQKTVKTTWGLGAFPFSKGQNQLLVKENHLLPWWPNVQKVLFNILYKNVTYGYIFSCILNI